MELITRSTSKVGASVALVGETGQMLGAIVQRVGDVTAMVNLTADSAQRQALHLGLLNATGGGDGPRDSAERRDG